jgi:hypothetical protein
MKDVWCCQITGSDTTFFRTHIAQTTEWPTFGSERYTSTSCAWKASVLRGRRRRRWLWLLGGAVLLAAVGGFGVVRWRHGATGNNVLAEARGWSAATLLVAIPVAVVSLLSAHRGSLRGRLAWLGSLAYFVYTYLEFAAAPRSQRSTCSTSPRSPARYRRW